MPLNDAQRRRLSQDLKRIAKVIERELERATGQSVGFSLVIWGAFGEDRMIQYVANVAREDAARHMLGLLEAWDEGMPDIAFHDRH
ncbi:MAG TPA: hypothetical protein VGM09_25205 [Bradyrhizobium sp.]|jgi:hypothetical protein